MMLSRLFLNPMSRRVHRAVGDAQRMHQSVMSGFPDGATESARAAHGVLYRLEVNERSGRIVLYVQSSSTPDWQKLPEGFLLDLDESDIENPSIRSLAPLLAGIGEGDLLSFRLRANVTRRVRGTEERPKGPRVPVCGEAGRRAWLERKARTHGFTLAAPEFLRIREEPRLIGLRKGDRLTFNGVVYDGLLRVISVESIRAGIRSGIGPAKAYGFGLLSLAKP